MEEKGDGMRNLGAASAGEWRAGSILKLNVSNYRPRQRSGPEPVSVTTSIILDCKTVYRHRITSVRWRGDDTRNLLRSPH